MSVHLQLLRDTAANLATYTGPAGEVVVDTTNNQLILEDGVTEGGHIIGGGGLPASAYGATAQWVRQEEEITLSGSSTAIAVNDTCLLFSVSLYVITAISGATSITVGDTGMGDGHWGSGIGVSAGSSSAGVGTPGYCASGSSQLSLKAVGGGASFTGGTVRVSLLYLKVTPPTS